MAGPTRASTSCSPAVELDGDEDVVAELREALARAGISGLANDGCPSARATLERDGESIRIVFDDAYGRRTTRSVLETATASSLIESWVRTDTTSSLLALPPAPTPSPAAQPEPTHDVAPSPTHRPERPSVPSGSLDLRLEAAQGTDGSLWGGVAVAGCVTLGPLCAGALARTSKDSRLRGDSHRLESDRIGAEVLLTGGWPIELGAVRFMPGAGVGLGWTRISRKNPYVPGDSADVDSGGLRAEAFVLASLPVSRRLSLSLGAAASISPVAHANSFFDDQVELAGEPRGLLRLSLGVSFVSP